MEEAVVVRWQWERNEILGLRKGEGTDEEESCKKRAERGRVGHGTESERW